MKFTTFIYLWAIGAILLFSCKKDEDVAGNNSACENCIIIAPDTAQAQDNSGPVPTAIISGTQVTVSLTSQEGFPDEVLQLSIGNSGDLLSEHISLDGNQTLTWNLSNLSPGVYPVLIRQPNYVTGSNLPDINYHFTSSAGTVGPVAPLAKVNAVTSEVEYRLNLQVNQ